MMEAIADSLTAAAVWTWQNSLHGSLLILALLLLLWSGGARIAPGLRAALWILVAVRLLLPFAPPSALSIWNVAPVPESPRTSTNDPEAAENFMIPVATPDLAEPTTVPTAAAPRPRVSPSPTLLLSILWLAGLLSILGFSLFRQIRTARWIRRLPAVSDPELRRVLVSCARKASVPLRFQFVQAPSDTGVAVFGFLRATHLLVPANLAQRYSEAEIRGIFLHELEHVRRHDLLWNWVALAVQALHWFNPLAWLAGRRFLVERELVCDRAALNGLPAEARPSYGSTLLKALGTGRQPVPNPALTPFLSRKRELEHRLTMIAKQPRRNLPAQIIVLALAAAAGLTTFTSATAEDDPERATPENRERTELHIDSDLAGKVIGLKMPIDSEHDGKALRLDMPIDSELEGKVLHLNTTSIDSSQPPEGGADEFQRGDQDEGRQGEGGDNPLADDRDGGDSGSGEGGGGAYPSGDQGGEAMHGPSGGGGANPSGDQGGEAMYGPSGGGDANPFFGESGDPGEGQEGGGDNPQAGDPFAVGRNGALKVSVFQNGIVVRDRVVRMADLRREPDLFRELEGTPPSHAVITAQSDIPFQNVATVINALKVNGIRNVHIRAVHIATDAKSHGLDGDRPRNGGGRNRRSGDEVGEGMDAAGGQRFRGEEAGGSEPADVPELLRALKSEHQTVAEAAKNALIELGNLGKPPTQAVPALLRMLESDDPDVRERSVYVLVHLAHYSKAARKAALKFALEAIKEDENVPYALDILNEVIHSVPPEIVADEGVRSALEDLRDRSGPQTRERIDETMTWLDRIKHRWLRNNN